MENVLEILPVLDLLFGNRDEVQTFAKTLSDLGHKDVADCFRMGISNNLGDEADEDMEDGEDDMEDAMRQPRYVTKSASDH